MVKMVNFVSFLLVAAVFLNPTIAIGDKSSTSFPEVILNICKHTSSPSLCLSTLKPILPITNPEPSTILLLLIQSSKKQTAEARDVLIAQNSKVPNNALAAMKNCEMWYMNSLDNYDGAIDATERDDWETVNTQLSAVINWYSQCGHRHGPWDAFNSKLNKLVDICFDLLKQSRV